MVSSFFLIYLCLMQAISFAVQYSSATFGFLLNVGSFLSVLDTYQQMAKNLAREVLHATFFDFPPRLQFSPKGGNRELERLKKDREHEWN